MYDATERMMRRGMEALDRYLKLPRQDRALLGRCPSSNREEWRRYLGDLWRSLEEWPPEVRPGRPLPAALVDQVITAPTAQARARAVLLAAIGNRKLMADPRQFRRSLARRRQSA